VVKQHYFHKLPVILHHSLQCESHHVDRKVQIICDNIYHCCNCVSDISQPSV
jgi:hypothetical protein